MQSAIYFPFTEPRHHALFLKNALFLWDSVDFVVPWRDFSSSYPDKETAEAFEMIGRNYVPTDDDKRRIHDELMDFCTGDIPDSLFFQLERSEVYGFYPQKLFPETWDMLVESKLATIVKNDGEVRAASTNALFGYYMMSVVAVCCANGRKRLVTDDNDPYRTLGNILIDKGPSEGSAAESWHGRLVAMTLGAPDLSLIPIGDLIELRKKDEHLVNGMRRVFVSALDAAVLDISKHADNINIVRDIVQSFTESMESDLRELKRGLKRAATSAILSPVGGVTVLSAIASVARGIPLAGFVTIGGLSKSLMDYQDRRRKLLSEHPSAWLFAGANQFKAI